MRHGEQNRKKLLELTGQTPPHKAAQSMSFYAFSLFQLLVLVSAALRLTQTEDQASVSVIICL